MVFVLSAAIIGIAWLLRRPMKMIGLPIVIGEMLAGFLLGPTFFGRLAPHAFNTLFSSESLQQIGRLAGFIITTYYFVIGLEFDGRRLKGQHSSLILTALLSGFLPAAFGFLLAGPVAAKIGMATPIPFKFALALVFSVTAFPVLLRMLENAGYDKHAIGTFSMGSTGFLELLIWASLPVILALATAGSLLQTFATIGWTVLFLVTWFTLVRKGLQWLWCKIPTDGGASSLLPILVGIVSAYIAGHIGIRPNLGALVGGFILPRNVSSKLVRKIKPVCVVLLPIFFAATGLKTKFDLRGGNEILLLILLVLLAYGVKIGSTTLAARWTGGFNWSEATTIGHLMCAKGAIGFAILEICSSSGLLEPKGYSMMAFVILTSTVLAAWGVALQQRWGRNYEVRRGLPLAADR